MSVALNAIPADDELLQAFHVIDSRIARGANVRPLVALRRRLAGELLGEAGLVDATLAPGFEVVTVAGGSRTVTDRSTVVAAIAGSSKSPGSHFIWVELADLLSDGDALAGHGVLRTLRRNGSVRDGVENDRAGSADISLTAVPIALFLSFDGDLMTSETIYLDTAAAVSATLPTRPVPSAEQLRALLDPNGDYERS